jgi:hypothetical protein
MALLKTTGSFLRSELDTAVANSLISNVSAILADGDPDKTDGFVLQEDRQFFVYFTEPSTATASDTSILLLRCSGKGRSAGDDRGFKPASSAALDVLVL